MDLSLSESSDEDFEIQRRALDVYMPDNFDPESIPETGEEYLRHVIYERTQKCEKIAIAKKDFAKFGKNQNLYLSEDETLPKVFKKFRPTKKWQEEALEDFRQLRNFLENTQKGEPTKQMIHQESFLRHIDETPPLFSDIVCYTQAAKIKMLHAIFENYLRKSSHASGISESVGTWVYAILALLEMPLTPDCYFKLREFAKQCITIRATFREDADESLSIPLNLFICIIARFFKQLDLADE